MSLTPTALLFVQLALVLVACWVVSAAAARVLQPPVLGQMIAGVLLGPSVFGLLLPRLHEAVFPSSSLAVLSALGNLGLVLYMFLVGLELDFAFLRRSARTGAAVSAAGLAVPFLLGGLLATQLVGDRRFFPADVHPWVGELFMAVAISVTAFPVMARIIADHGLSGTRLANLCLVCGSFTDVAAWCLLAVALAGLAGSPVGAAVTVVGAAAIAAAVLLGVRPLLARHGFGASQEPSARQLSVVLILLVTTAALTEAIGVHPAFGAFLVGAAIPRHAPMAAMRARLQPLVADLLLPLYFVYTGLHTRLTTIDAPDLVLVCGLVVLVACAGKGVTCWLVARLSGQSPRDAVAIGVLMNARGIVELVVLTVGLQRQVITPTLFSMLVTMTIVTTLLPSPVLRWLYGDVRPAAPGDAPLAAMEAHR